MNVTLRRKTKSQVPTTPVICSNCGCQLNGTETVDGIGYRVRRHRDRMLECPCPGVHRTDHQPVVVFPSDVLDREVSR